MLMLSLRLGRARGRHGQAAALAVSVLCLGAAAGMARAADVYVSYDAEGVARFAPRAVDASYRLLFKDLRSPVAAAGRLREPAAEVEQALRAAAARHGVDYALLYAVAGAESGFNTAAISPKGAIGLMQIMPDTGRRYGVPGADGEALRANLQQLHVNVDAGTRYLRDLLKLFDGDTALAVAAYNAGEGAVKRYGNRIPPFDETQTYVTRVMGTLGQPLAAAAAPPAPSAQAQSTSAQSTSAQSTSAQSTSAGQAPAGGDGRLTIVPGRHAPRAGRPAVQVYLGASQEIQRFEGGFATAR